MKKACLLLCVISIAFSTYRCSSAYKLEKESVLSPNRPYFQNWIANIKDAGSGYNVILPNLNPNNQVILDSIYFRGIKGKLVKGRAIYSAKLKNRSPYERDMSIEAAFKKEKKSKFPFELSNMDCVISYTENGKTKYLKVSGLTEKEGIYHEKGLAVQEIED
ncbi:hypothetical protein [Winogradskyella sp. UBA3174]|uniref:hypothetical protein n=1 Tax=Winogradskyella sp. UBA3174 TaxID=1947785 RepID=UPI00260045B7|nr:hypothetical protein [Winogradskyella sp. UBA3174]|tara:strand:+ start:2382 stop:2867 length:486 start_codon:yes stop_codon:yes gene_type:complete